MLGKLTANACSLEFRIIFYSRAPGLGKFRVGISPLGWNCGGLILRVPAEILTVMMSCFSLLSLITFTRLGCILAKLSGVSNWKVRATLSEFLVDLCG